MNSIPNLLPGQDYLTHQHDDYGREVVVYAYRTENGVFFSCVCTTEAEARDRCASWILTQERHRHHR